LLLDEPTHHLDIESIEALIDALENFSGSIIMVTHSELILRRLNLTKIIHCQEAQQTVFLGTYDEFLEKVGWEESEKKTSPKKKESNDRQVRADFVNKRAAALKPIEKEIQECEKKIIALEEQQKQKQSLMEKGESSPDLIKALGLLQKEIEQQDRKLYELYDLLQQKKQEFEEQ
jgi:ATP-binding cassette subfamily F protein 3